MRAPTLPRRAALVGLGALGCAGERAVPAAAPRDGTAPDRPPAEHVAAAGLTWLLLTRPAAWLAHADLRAACSTALGADPEVAFTEGTGLTAAEVSELVVAGSPLGRATLAVTPDGGAAAEERFSARLDDAPLVRSPAAGVRWLSGVHRGQPRHLLRLPGRLVVVVERDTTLARVAVAYALGRLTSPTALRGASLRSLPTPAAAPLARVLWPGPFPEEPGWAAESHGLVGGLFAAELRLERAAPGRLLAHAVLVGALPPDPEARVRETWSALAESAVGRLLGLPGAEPGAVRRHGDVVEFSATLGLDPLAHGARDLIGPWPPPGPAATPLSPASSGT